MYRLGRHEFLPETLQCDPPISVLAPMITGHDGHARGLMREADSRLRNVLVLAAGTTRTEDIDATLTE